MTAVNISIATRNNFSFSMNAQDARSFLAIVLTMKGIESAKAAHKKTTMK
jgi:hypothetical protein